MAYAKLSGADKVPDDESNGDDETDEETGGKPTNQVNPPIPPTPAAGKVKIMEGERVAFTEELEPGNYLKLVASGDLNDFLLEALEDFVKRQRKRLKASLPGPNTDNTYGVGQPVPATGSYEVHHYGHSDGKGRADFSKGEPFPPCVKCAGGNVRYTAARD